jgi:type I restriction enzyme R subunit
MSDEATLHLTPEAQARVGIDAMLGAAGWLVQDRNEINLYAGRGVAVREYLLKAGLEVDYLLFVDGRTVGALEAKKVGAILIGVEIQSAKYAGALPMTSASRYGPHLRFSPSRVLTPQLGSATSLASIIRPAPN